VEIKIGGKPVGDGHRCFIIAEIGSNHNQDLSLALKHIDAAAEAGVDAVKFQTFKAENHYSKRMPEVSYLDGTNIYQLIQSIELNRDWQAGLKDHCEQRGVTFMSSPCDPEAVDQLAALGMEAFKVASFDLPDLELVELVAQTGKPAVLSTGMADWMDIQRAVDTCRKAGNNQIVLLQCTSLYPAPPELTNLRSIRVMREAFGVLAGYSDHTIGDHVSVASVAAGACIIEKHFTLDRALPGPDHSFAIEPQELKDMVKRVRDVDAALGDGVKNGPRALEQEMFEKCRRSIHAAKAIKAGEIITRDKLVAKRPGLGVPPFMIDQLLGRPAKVDIEADEWVTWNHV